MIAIRDRVRFVETDMMGVVHHANYLRYFEFGRASLMREADYPYKQIEESGYIYPIIKTELNYHSPLFYDDLMYIHTRPARLELVKVQFDYLITRADNGEIACTGFTRHCAVKADSNLPVATHGAHTFDENCTKVAVEPSGVPSSVGPRVGSSRAASRARTSVSLR